MPEIIVEMKRSRDVDIKNVSVCMKRITGSWSMTGIRTLILMIFHDFLVQKCISVHLIVIFMENWGFWRTFFYYLETICNAAPLALNLRHHFHIPYRTVEAYFPISICFDAFPSYFMKKQWFLLWSAADTYLKSVSDMKYVWNQLDGSHMLHFLL